MKDSKPQAKPEAQKDPKEAEKEAKEEAKDDLKDTAMDIQEVANKFLDKGDYQVHILIEEVRELKGPEDSE
jgi:vacuolar-type H+-ATPase subunit H